MDKFVVRYETTPIYILLLLLLLSDKTIKAGACMYLIDNNLWTPAFVGGSLFFTGKGYRKIYEKESSYTGNRGVQPLHSGKAVL